MLNKNFFSQELKEGIPFTLLGLLLIIFLYTYPLLFAVVNSLYFWLLPAPHTFRFVGLGNYLSVLQMPHFWNSVRVTVIFSISSVVLSLFFGILLAIAMNIKQKGQLIIKNQKITKMFLIFPIVVNPSVTGIIYRLLIWGYDRGIVNNMLESIGINRIPWLISSRWALLTLVITAIWSYYPMVFLVADSSIQTIPSSLFDAAQIDGVSRLQEIFYIIIPSIKPQLLTAVILVLTLAFRQFGIVYVLTGGGPLRATELFNIAMYRQLSVRHNFGYALAMAIMLIIVVALTCGLLLKYFGSSEGGYSEK